MWWHFHQILTSPAGECVYHTLCSWPSWHGHAMCTPSSWVYANPTMQWWCHQSRSQTAGCRETWIVHSQTNLYLDNTVVILMDFIIVPDIVCVSKRWKNKKITEATKTCKLCSLQILVFNMQIGFELVLTTMNKFLHKNCYRKAFAHVTEVPAHCDRLYIVCTCTLCCLHSPHEPPPVFWYVWKKWGQTKALLSAHKQPSKLT